MSVSRRQSVATALAALLVITGAFALARQAGASGQELGAIKLEGAWIARVATPAFPVTPQWTYVLVPDGSGKHATIYGSVDVGFGTPGVDHDSPLVGEMVRTGFDTAAFKVVWHRIDSAGHILAIGTVSGTATFTAPGKAGAIHHFAIYAAAADADGDGLPDPETTVVPTTFTLMTMDTRVPSAVQ